MIKKFQINSEYFLLVKRDAIVLEYKFSFHAIQMIKISPELNPITTWAKIFPN